MSLFKSTKNQSASAAASPAQTPRPSVDAQRPAAQTTKKMTTEQALDSILHKAVQTMPSISTVISGGSDIEVALGVSENVVKGGDGSGIDSFLAIVLHSIQVSAGLIHLGLCF
ncbi:hypothetical protein BKA57DRAFT_511657 [Linnemannia elongata]|nr:hypothetical protein BKA57DRAFT_511657 [Linnemannia elongata]